MEKKIKPITPPYVLVLLFAGLVFMLFLGGHFYFQKQRSEIKAEQQAFLSAISAFKVDEISEWISERKAEGVFLANSKDFLELVVCLNKDPDNKKICSQVESWLMPIKKNHEYTGIWVVSPAGRVLAFYCDADQQVKSSQLKAILKTENHGFQDFSDIQCVTKTGRKTISSVVPLNYQGKPAGYLLFRLDPEKYLFPRIASWPVKKETGENLLVSVNGDTVTYHINRPQYSRSPVFLRNGKADSLTRSVPLSGTLAMVEATDYRGNEVLADIKRIPGTRWSLITKIDQAAVYAPLLKRAFNIVLYLLTFLLVVVVSGILIWKNQQLQYYRTRYQLQQESARAEEKIRFMTALLEDVNDAIITFDKDLIIQSWNKGAERIYGWTAGEVVGKFGGGSLRVDFPGISREAVFKELEQSGSWKGEVIHKRKDGSTAYMLSSTSQLRDENGNLLGIMTINKDISEVIHSEKSRNAVYRISELAHSTRNTDELYASIHIVIGELMDASNLYIALLDPDKGTVSFPYFVDEKELPPPPGPLGNGLTEFVLRTGKPLLARPADTGYMVDRGLIDLVGEPAIDWLGVPLKAENETIGVLVVQSYNPRVRYGEREKNILIFVSEQIALTIHRRKIQKELIEAKQNAEVSSKLASALLANMNHELRTPMNGILGFAEILLDELTDPEARIKASNILVSGRRLMETLDAIMDLSYLESDKVSRQFKPVNIDKIVRNVLAVFEPVRREKNIQFFHEVEPGIEVLGNEHLVQHLLKNLVDNAVKYTETGSVNIGVSKVVKDGIRYVSVSVKDTGIGISPEHHRMIFDAFRQVSEGYGRQFEGTGLGLTICKKIVDLMNGEISVTSVIGEGSEFTFLLPAVEIQEKQVMINKSEILKPQTHPAGRTSMPDILLVEDNLVNLQLLMVYVRDFCNIYSALDGKSAIEMTLQRKFDAILMDINLGPGMDGIQAMLEIRKRPDYRKVPIVAITGYASIGDSDRLLSIGFSEYLAKPYEKEAVAELMRSLFPEMGS